MNDAAVGLAVFCILAFVVGALLGTSVADRNGKFNFPFSRGIMFLLELVMGFGSLAIYAFDPKFPVLIAILGFGLLGTTCFQNVKLGKPTPEQEETARLAGAWFGKAFSGLGG